MKHSGLSEVSTIFHPKKNRAPTPSDEYAVNQPLDSLQKMIDNTGILLYFFKLLMFSK